ncbi:hypothetical protein N7486_003746, partial [Penicillium sp. IBT 16267x]
YAGSLENRILELEAQTLEQVSNSLPQRSESIQNSTVPPERRNETNSPISRPTQPSVSLFVPPTEMDLQTPMTIQASSPIVPNTPGMTNHSSRTGFRSAFEGSEPVEQGTTFKDLQFSDQKERALIQTYLERVNPRYPFIHEEKFLKWYSSWKDLKQFGRDIPVGEQWKSFFIQMAFAVSLLIAPQVSPEERRLSNTFYSIALSSLSVFNVHDTCTAFSLVSNRFDHDIDDNAMLCDFSATSIHLFANMSDSEIQRWEPRSRSQADVESLPRQTQVSSSLHLIRLDQWRNQLQPHSDPESRGYTSQGWVGMAYNYTILLLHRPTKDNVRGIVGEKCLQACANNLSVFRQYQKDRQTAQLWPGVNQFGIGITLLYCFWATPPSSRTDLHRSSKSLTAIHTCSVILAVFAEQWRQAEPLRDLFDTLSEAIPYHPLTSADDTGNRISADAASSIRPTMPHIISLVVNVNICRMITEMVTEDYPWHDQRSSDEFPAWPSEIHCSQTCSLCQDKTASKSISVPEVFGLYEPSVSHHGEFFTFPGLFGSVEF